jgi:DNA polymerase III delta prime subunit
MWIESAVIDKRKKDILWVEKYKPKKLSEYIGNRKEIKLANEWLEKFKTIRSKTDYEKLDFNDFPKVLLLSGEPGVGKTSLAHLLLKEAGYHIIEHNSSNIRGKKNIEKFFRKSLSYNYILDMFNDHQTPLSLIMDEIDTLCLGGSDKGGMNELLSIIKEDRKRKNEENILITNPIICTYNDFSDKKLTELKKYSLHLHIKKPDNRTLSTLLKRIIKNESLIIPKEYHKEIISYAKNDYRRLIFILEYLSTNNKEITKESVIELRNKFMEKDKEFNLEENIVSIFNEQLDINHMFYIFNNETFKIPLYIHENCVNFVKTCSSLDYNQKIEILTQLMNFCSKSDYLHTFIFNNKFWNLFYVNALYGIIKPNFLLNNETLTKNKVKSVKFSSILSKISQKHTNRKLILNSIESLSHIKMKLTKETLVLLGNFIHYNLTDKRGDIHKLVKYMKLKNIRLKDIDVLLKLTKLNELEIIKIRKCSSYYKKKLKKLLEQAF